MSDDETYFKADESLRREHLSLMSLKLHQMFPEHFQEQPTTQQMERLEEIQSRIIAQGPPMPKEGEVFGYQILRAIMSRRQQCRRSHQYRIGKCFRSSSRAAALRGIQSRSSDAD